MQTCQANENTCIVSWQKTRFCQCVCSLWQVLNRTEFTSVVPGEQLVEMAEVNPGGKIPQPLVKRSLQLLCQDVLPAFR